MCPVPENEESKSEVVTSRIAPWLHKGVGTLAKLQETSMSAKAAQYIEEGFRRELEETNFEEELKAKQQELEELGNTLRTAHQAALASIEKRNGHPAPKDN
jgi:hypothetical protein